jgi:predicted ThiF/HesA family dinucleotide-utilizing enzyme
VSDSVGNKAKGLVRTVKVQDTTGPVIKLNGEVLVTHEAGNSYTDRGASAVDVVDGDLSEEVNVVSTVDASKPGDYTVSYAASDAAGNKAKEAVRKVKVLDTRGPVITLKGEVLVTYEAGSGYTDLGASAVDLVDGNLSEEMNVVSTVNSVKPGNYKVNYGVSDSVGNKTMAIRKVTIVDTTPPVIKLGGGVLVTHEAGGIYTDGGATASDLVDGDLSGDLEVESTVNIGKPGVYSISYGVSDALGNKARAAVREVSVVDTTGPVITLNGGEVVTHEAGGRYKD